MRSTLRRLIRQVRSRDMVPKAKPRRRPTARMTRNIVPHLPTREEYANRQLRLRPHVQLNRVRHHQRAIRDSKRRQPAESHVPQRARVDGVAPGCVVERQRDGDGGDRQCGPPKGIRYAQTVPGGRGRDVDGLADGGVWEDEPAGVEGRWREVCWFGQLGHRRPGGDPFPGAGALWEARYLLRLGDAGDERDARDREATDGVEHLHHDRSL